MKYYIITAIICFLVSYTDAVLAQNVRQPDRSIKTIEDQVTDSLRTQQKNRNNKRDRASKPARSESNSAQRQRPVSRNNAIQKEGLTAQQRQRRPAAQEQSDNSKAASPNLRKLKQRFKNMSPEDRRKAFIKLKEMRPRAARILKSEWKKFKTLAPAERLKRIESLKTNNPRLAEKVQRIENIRQEIASLPPEQRDTRLVDLKEEFAARKQARREFFMQRWNNATVEKKQRFCAAARNKCAGSVANTPRCKFVAQQCKGAL